MVDVGTGIVSRGRSFVVKSELRLSYERLEWRGDRTLEERQFWST